MTGKIVFDDAVTSLEFRSEDLANIGEENLAVYMDQGRGLFDLGRATVAALRFGRWRPVPH